MKLSFEETQIKKEFQQRSKGRKKMTSNTTNKFKRKQKKQI